MGTNRQFVPYLLQQVPPQRQPPEEAEQGNQGAASDWVPPRGGGALKCGNLIGLFLNQHELSSWGFVPISIPNPTLS